MRVLLLATLYNVLNVIVAQIDIVNKDLGDFHFQAAVGHVPLKYIPLSEKDQKASDKASDKAADLIDSIQLVEYIDPLYIPLIGPLGIDVPFLFLRSKVYLHSLGLKGVKQLALHGLELRLINLRSDLNITIPQLYFEAHVQLKTSLSFMPIMFNWLLSVNLFDVSIAVASGGCLTQAPTVGEVLQIESAAVKVDIRDVVFNLTTDMGDDLVVDFEEYDDEDRPVTQLFSKRSCNSSASNGNILNYVLQSTLDMANKKLRNIPIEFFKDYLLSDTY